jgi:hypothetical protein
MLDLFLKHAYKTDKTAAEEEQFVELLKKLPLEELHKLATGEMSIEDLASNGGGEGGWIDKFKGTPLFQMAMDLEQRELQMEAAQMQRNDLESMNDRMRDKLTLEKKMLEMELAKADAAETEPGAANFVGDPPPEPSPVAGSPDAPPAEAGTLPPGATPAQEQPTSGSPVAEDKPEEKKEAAEKKKKLFERMGERSGEKAEGIMTALGGAQGLVHGAQQGIAKGKSPARVVGRAAAHGAAGALIGKVTGQFMKGNARGLAKESSEKAAVVEALQKAAGALDLKGIGSRALQIAKKNPGMVAGAGIGALADGPQGALEGAAIGAGAEGIHRRMKGPNGKGFVDAAKGALHSAGQQAKFVVNGPKKIAE